jgi:hypothetical protein
MTMNKRTGLIKALIHFHWKNIVKDNANIDAVEMDARMKVIRELRARIGERDHYKKQVASFSNRTLKNTGGVLGKKIKK